MTITRFFLASALTLLLAAISTAQPNERRGDHGPVDLDGDGSISRAEFDTFSDARFDRMDKNGDGLISEDEKPQHPRRPGHRGKGGAKGHHGEHRQMMGAGLLTRLADSDQDGTVTAGEWQDFLVQLPLDAEGNIDAASFAESLPSPEECTQCRKHHGGSGGGEAGEGARRQGPPRDRSHMVSRMLDTNDNQVLETADFEALFTALDADQDGSLSGDEIPTPRHHRRHGG
jgi:Ca2+-binding EF-hand superfamily protein